jgi:type III pantothenate kinase
MSLLVIDLGNTRLKWGRMDSDGLLVGEPVVHMDTNIEQLLDKVWTFAVIPQRVVIASVASDTLRLQVENWLIAKWGVKAEKITSSAQLGELKNAYLIPEQLGCDRWVAMLEAFYTVKTAVCVVDCGSAVTIDAVDKQGKHLGGMILPGFSAMTSALTANTGLSFLDNVLPDSFQLARSTHDAIALGTSQAIISLVLRTLKWLEQVTGESVKCFITGGDGEKLSALLECEHIVDNDLVIKGLVRIAGEF